MQISVISEVVSTNLKAGIRYSDGYANHHMLMIIMIDTQYIQYFMDKQNTYIYIQYTKEIEIEYGKANLITEDIITDFR